MPKREDEFWAGQKESLRYCSEHKRYYDERVGCQLCHIDHLSLKVAATEAPQLKQCPQCRRRSLFWNEYAVRFECLKPTCKKTYSKEEYDASSALCPDEMLKCPRCGEMSVIWNRYFVYYECANCTKTFARHEIELT